LASVFKGVSTVLVASRWFFCEPLWELGQASQRSSGLPQSR